jgi:hypothetical protein
VAFYSGYPGAMTRPDRAHTRYRDIILFVLGVAVVSVAIYQPLSHGLALRRAAYRIRRDGPSLMSELLNQGTRPEVARVRAMRRDLQQVSATLDTLRRSSRWLSERLARQRAWPWLSRQALLADRGLLSATDLSAVALGAALSVEHGLERSEYAAQPMGDALDALAQDRERLLRAREALAEAATVAGTGRFREPLRLAVPALDVLLMAPQVLGDGTPRTYLLLIQNADELRATGGFISSVAVLDVAEYRLAGMRYLNSYDVEAYYGVHPAPPAPLRQHMGAGILLFRDANWSPDFPTSAEVLAALWMLDMRQEVDGILAMDAILVRQVLQAMGPLNVPQYDLVITADNVLDTAVALWENPVGAPSLHERDTGFGLWLSQRKAFGEAFLSAMVDRLSQPQPGDMLALLEAVADAARGGHAQAWALNDRDLQEDLRRFGLAGEVARTRGDYLMVVDSNMGWNKADRNIGREIDYEVEMTADGPVARLCLTYRHGAPAGAAECSHGAGYADSYEAMTEQCYWNYVRALVPQGSVLRHAEGAQGPVDVTAESGKTVLGTMVVVPPGETVNLCLSYALPGDIFDAGEGAYGYRLIVQKQAGIAGALLRVRLDPGDRAMFHSAPRPWMVDDLGVATVEGWLDRDVEWVISWAPHGRQR